MDFFKAVDERFSFRGNYTDAIVPDEDLIKIVDAGLKAPSGGNKQTTHFIIVTNPEIRAELAKILVCDAVSSAPAIIVGMSERGGFCEVEDYSAAVENILLASVALGYASCWFDGTTRMDGRDAAMAKLLGVPDERRVRTIIPVGVPQAFGKPAPKKPFDERVQWRR